MQRRKAVWGVEDRVYELLNEAYELLSYAETQVALDDETRRLHYAEVAQFALQMKQRMLENGYVKEDSTDETW